MHVRIHVGSIVYGPQLTLVNAIIYVRGFYGVTLVCICYSFILSLNQIHFDIYLIIHNPSTPKSVHKGVVGFSNRVYSNKKGLFSSIICNLTFKT